MEGAEAALLHHAESNNDATPLYVEERNEDVFCLRGVFDHRYRNAYGELLSYERGPNGRVPVRILPNMTRNVPQPAAGKTIMILPHSLRRVPPMLYYTTAHPVVAAWIAAHATPEMLAAQDVPAEFANSRSMVAVGVPSGSLAARYYMDCWPDYTEMTPGLLRLIELNAREYERDSPAGATARRFEVCIARGALPPPELYVVRY